MKRQISFALMFLFLLPLYSCGNRQEKPVAGQPDAKYIFMFIGDGMGAAQVSAADAWLSYKAGKFGGEQVGFARFPVLGMATTYSANSNITDSSAGGTAISSGVKINNGEVGQLPDGTPVESIATRLQNDFGYNVGVFSSVPLNHATPASFYAHTDSRGKYYEITSQIPASGFKFVGGSGILQFDGPNHDKDSEEFLTDNGYKVAFGQREYEAAVSDGAQRIVMVANPVEEHRKSVANYSSERDTLVSLSQMMRDCIGYLGEEKPFFIMCEGGEIDWYAHSNMALPMIDAIIKMDDAVSIAYDFYLRHPDETLIVITADHETGGFTLGCGGYSFDMSVLEKQALTPEGVYNINREDNAKLNRKAGMGWTTPDHTGSPVPVYAVGKGAEKFGGRYDNTDISKKIMNTYSAE